MRLANRPIGYFFIESNEEDHIEIDQVSFRVQQGGAISRADG